MSVYTKIVTSVLFPLHEKLKKHTTTAVHHQLDRTQWLSSEQLREFQIERLRNFLCDIGEKVPYYKDLFLQLDFDPKSVASLGDLQKLPFCGKSEIREHTERLKAVGASELKRFNTGGSSGEPLIFYLGNERVSHDVAAKRRATRWWDVDIGDSEIVVWGSPIELNSQDRVRQLRDWLFRTELISAFEMSDTNLGIFVDQIRNKKPAMLFGYPSSLAHIAKYAHSKNIRMDDLGIKVAFVTSERLYDYQRAQIESVFGCPVANGYGGRDAGFIAHECPEGAMHLTAEDIIVEIVKPDGTEAVAGESGEIVVTHMATSEFPFVRYRTGDIGAIGNESCSCGRGLPVLRDLQGRTTDFLIALDGTVIHGLALIYILRDLDSVKEFKIIQESLELIRVLVVPDVKWCDEDRVSVENGFRARLGDAVQVQVDIESKIESEKSGKRRYVVSHVSASANNPG